MSISSSLLQKIALVLVGLALALPLLSAPPWFSPPSWGKTVVFRVLVVLLALAALWLFGRLPKEQRVLRLRTQSPLFLPLLFLGLFTGTMLLATAFSLDPFFSFWGTPARSWGFLNFLFAAAFGLLAFLLLKERQWRLVWAAALGAGALVALVAFAQQWGVKLTDTFATFSARPVATLGSPLVLGAYLAVLAPGALGAALFAKRRKNILFALLFAGIFLALLVALFFTLSRGAWIGAAAALVFFALLYPTLLSHRLRFVSLGLLAALLLGVGIALFLPFPSLLQQEQLASQISVRFAPESIQQDPRLQAWPGLIRGVFNRPLLGYGPYNSSIAFDKYYTTDIVSATGWWDSAHNLFLDIALWAGIPGLFLFCGFLGVLFWRLWQVKRKVPEYALYAHATQAALLAYVGALFFSFDVFPLILLFFLLVGFSFFLISRLPLEIHGTQPRVFSAPDFAASPFFRGAFAVVAVWFLYTFTFQPFLWNKELVLARHEAENLQCQQAIGRVDPLANSDSFFTEYARSQYIDVIGTCIRHASPEASMLLSQKAVELLSKNVKLRPLFTRNWILLGGYTNNLIAAADGQETKAALAQNAQETFQKARELSPKREEIYKEWIRTHTLLGDYEGAIARAQECIALEPKSGECWLGEADAHIQLGDLRSAAGALAQAKQKGYYVVGEENLRSYIALYNRLLEQEEKREYYEELAWAYQRLIGGDPNTFEYYTALAFAYRELGQYEQAKQAALNAQRVNPDITQQVNEFLKTLPSEYAKNTPQLLIYTLILEKDYVLAKEQAAECVQRFPENTHCGAWGLVAELWLGERDSLRLGSSDPPFPERLAKHFYTPNFLEELRQFYQERENHEQLVEVYTRLLRVEENPEYIASLASVYAKLGSWEDAAKTAFKLYQLQPEAKDQARVFLQDVLAKQKSKDPVRYNELLRHQPYQEIQAAFPDMFESL